MRENTLLPLLREVFAARDPSVRVGCGPDDCAHLAVDGLRLAASADAFAEGSHFLADTPAGEVAWKALGASLSDLAASACRARWALVSLCLRPGLAPDWAGDFARGLGAAAREFSVSIVGGDTTASPAGLFVSVAVVGEPLPGGPLLRGGARPGDILVATGEFGGSLAGRHLRPVPRLREIQALMEFSATDGGGVFPSAGLDVSDGLALDLSRLCRESGVGAELDAAAIPVSAAAGPDPRPLERALTDGEDFELLLALPPALWLAFRDCLASREGAARFPGLARFTAVGRVTGGGLVLREPDGRTRPLAPGGFEHQW